jgi:hypothetical protein
MDLLDEFKMYLPRASLGFLSKDVSVSGVAGVGVSVSKRKYRKASSSVSPLLWRSFTPKEDQEEKSMGIRSFNSVVVNLSRRGSTILGKCDTFEKEHDDDEDEDDDDDDDDEEEEEEEDEVEEGHGSKGLGIGGKFLKKDAKSEGDVVCFGKDEDGDKKRRSVLIPFELPPLPKLKASPVVQVVVDERTPLLASSSGGGGGVGVGGGMILSVVVSNVEGDAVIDIDPCTATSVPAVVSAAAEAGGGVRGGGGGGGVAAAASLASAMNPRGVERWLGLNSNQVEALETVAVVVVVSAFVSAGLVGLYCYMEPVCWMWVPWNY